MHVGVAGVVGDVLVLEAGPGGAGDDLARLGDDVAEADLLVLLGQRQVGMIPPGDLGERVPGLHRHLAVGLRRQGQDHLGGIDGAVETRTALVRPLGLAVVELAEQVHLGLGLPADALAAVADALEQRADGGEALIGLGVVTLDLDQRRHGLAGNGLALALLPVLHIDLSQLGRGVVLMRQGDQVGLFAQMPLGGLGEGLGDTLEDLPVAARLPRRVGGRGQRVDEGVHVGGVEVILLVPGRRGQHDIRVEAGGGHAEVQGHQQVDLALGGIVMPLDLFRLLAAEVAQVLALDTVTGTQQVLEHVLVALAGAAQQVGTPDEHVAREVLGVVRILRGEGELALLELLDGVVLGGHAGGLGGRGQAQRVGTQLRRGRQPAHALGAHVEVDQAAGVVLGLGQRRQDLLDLELLVAPLGGVVVEEGGAVHVPRRTLPVEAEGQRGPAGLRAQLLLPDIVGPAAAALPDTATHDQHVDQATVVHVHVVPVVHAGTDDDHAATLGLVGILGELTGDTGGLLGGHAGDLLLPGRGVGLHLVQGGGTVILAKPAVDAVVGAHQVEHRDRERLGAVGLLQALDGQAVEQQLVAGAAALDVIEVFVSDAAEVGEGDLRHLVMPVGQGQQRLDLGAFGVQRLEVPLAHLVAGLAPAETDGAPRDHQLVAGLVPRHGLPLGVVALAQARLEVAGAHLAARRIAAVLASLELDQERHVGIAPHIVAEVAAALLEVELLEDDVTHGHGQGGIGALLGGEPLVGELGDLGVVRGDRDGLGTLVAHLGEEVGVRGPRLRHVGAPGDDVAGVVPVGGLGHVGLLAPGLGAGRGQVAVPVVERQADAADQRQIAGTGSVADHGHGGNRREADDAIRAVLLGGIDVGGADQLVKLVPVGAHEAAHAAGTLVLLGLGRVLDDGGPRLDRILLLLQRLAPQLEQRLADQRILEAVGAVHVPGVAGAPWAAPRLVVGQVGPGARIVGLLGLPGDQAILDVDLPAAGSGAVHPMGRAHDLVMLPALPVAVLPAAGLVAQLAVIIGKGLAGLAEEVQPIDEVTHGRSPGS